MDEAIIFYSWQSDDKKTKNYAEQALRAAVSKIASSPDVEFSPRLDKDTQGVAGAVEIARTILDKIQKSQVFVADVSLVDKSSNGRDLVNQNVMFELGYAISALGNENTILIANNDLGKVENLPFDIRGWRVATFSPKNDPTGQGFAKELASIIEVHLAQVKIRAEIQEKSTLRDDLLAAIENTKPTRTKAEKYFEEIYGRLVANAPERYRGKGITAEYGKKVYDAYQSALPIVEELAEIFVTASEYNDEKTIMAAYKKLEIITQYYDIMPVDNGHMYDMSKEYYGLVASELISILIGSLSREKRWNVIKEINNTKLNRAQLFDDERTLESLYIYPTATIAFYKEVKGVNFTIPMSPLLEERWASREDILRLYIDGNIFEYLFLPQFYPYTLGILTNSRSWKKFIPEYIKYFKSKDFFVAYMNISNDTSPEWAREALWSRIIDQIGDISYHFYSLKHLFVNEGIDSVEKLGVE